MKLHEKNYRRYTRHHHHSHNRQGRLSTSFTATTNEKKRQLKTMLCFILICIFYFVDASDNWKGQQRQITTRRDVRHSTSHNKWLQQNTNKRITLSYSTLFDTFRGGDTNSSSSKALIPTTTAATTTTPILEPEILDDTTTTTNKKSATSKLSSTIQSTTKSLRKIRQKQIITFFLLRLSFLLLLPPSTLLLALTLSFSALMTSLRILTLTFYFSNTSKIIYAITRASLALLLSCLTGLFSPPFAIFGLMAALSLSLLDVAEPLIRIRYNREMKKVKRLHQLIQDPVLVEALSLVRMGVGRIAVLGNSGGDSSSRVVVQEGTGDNDKIGDNVAMNYSKRITEGNDSKEEDKERGILRLFQREPKSITTTTTPVEISALQDEKTSNQLVETILSSPEAIQAKTKLIQKLPEPVANYLKKQFQSIKDSGVLEVAAGRALAALQKEVSGAVEFMPYLEAIERVRKEQQVLKKKKGQQQ